MTSKGTPKNDYGSIISALGTSWGSPRDLGLEIDVSGVDFGPYLSPWASKQRKNAATSTFREHIMRRYEQICAYLTIYVSIRKYHPCVKRGGGMREAL